MKTTLKFLFLFLATTIIAVSCKQAPEGEKAEVGQAQEVAAAEGATYTVSAADSKVNWKATKVGGGHVGTINISEGNLTVKDGAITSGQFTFDLNSIAATDLEGEYKGKLEGHLKAPDFFDVATYPTGKFEVVSVEALEGVEGATHKITGNLTLKDVTKSISFNANVTIAEDSVTATTPAFTINRTDFNIKYNSKFVLSAAELKEKAIDENVALEITLKATAQ